MGWSRRRQPRERDAVVDPIAALEQATAAALTSSSFDEALDTLATHIRDLVGCDEVAIFVVGDREGSLVLRAASASSGGSPSQVLEVPFGAGLVGEAAQRRATVVADDDRRHGPGITEPSTLPMSRTAPPLKAAAATPLLVDERVVGVLRVGSYERLSLTDDKVELTATISRHLASAVEGARLLDSERRSRLGAEHARSHLRLIAKAAAVFDSAVEDYERALDQLAEVMVPEFADWCFVDLVGPDGELHHHAMHHHHGARAADVDLEALLATHPDWTGPVRAAMATGQADLRHGLDRDSDGDGAPSPSSSSSSSSSDFGAVARALGIESSIIVPVRVRGLALGALTLGRSRERRGFRPSDAEAADEVACRAATTIERVKLYQETRRTGEVAKRHADTLRRWMEAAPEITAPLSRAELLQVVTDHARRIFRAEHAVAVLAGDVEPTTSPSGATGTDRLVARVAALAANDVDAVDAHGDDGDGGGALLVARITAASVGVLGAIAVAGRAGHPFDGEEEAVFLSLVQLAAAALENARLYQAVETSESRLRALVEAAPLSIIELAEASRITSWNRAAGELFGWPDASSSVEFPPSVRDAVAPLARRAERGEMLLDVQVVGERSDGTRLDLSVALAPLASVTGGTADGALLLIADVTKRKELERQLLVSQRLEAIGRLAGGVAHDFNNLLTIILGYTDLLLHQMGDGDGYRPDVEAIRNAGLRGAKLTAQLLAIGRHQMTEPTVVSVHEVVGGMEGVLRRLVPSDVELRVAVEPASLVIDPAQLEQVLLNLVVNAADAMPDGGRLVVEAGETTLADVWPATTGDVPPGRWTRLRVADTGTGMDPQVLDRCFEPFFTTKARDKGTGLGLATVHGIVDQLGGYVDLVSAPGVGTTVTVYLPACDPLANVVAETGGARRPESRRVRAPSGRVLVVEDEEPLRRLAVDVLSSEGYDVVSAAGGVEALAQVDAEPEGRIDLLVTDVIMPEMTGVELAERLSERRPGLPILYLSGYTGDAMDSLEAIRQSNNFLAKPFTTRQLVQRVRLLIEAAQAYLD
jgi:two-component system cell cycle sensor histidine kinase/response regulator CckA